MNKIAVVLLLALVGVALASVKKYSPRGKLLWSAPFSTQLKSEPVAVAADQLGNVYVLGTQWEIARYNAMGKLTWKLAERINGFGYGIACHKNLVYVVGSEDLGIGMPDEKLLVKTFSFTNGKPQKVTERYYPHPVIGRYSEDDPSVNRCYVKDGRQLVIVFPDIERERMLTIDLGTGRYQSVRTKTRNKPVVGRFVDSAGNKYRY